MRPFGKYRLVEPLASGGMADVWRAEVTGAAGVVKEVALKLIRGEHQAHGDFVRMFVEEARVACLLSNANVVQVFEFDQIDGQYYLAMELVRGRHLGLVLERAREAGVRLGLARTVHVGAEAAKALAYVHRLTDGGRPLGLVHRDVSPHNLLVSFEGEVKLADFGIARAMSLAGLTEPGTLKGKIAYMAPEQAAGGPVDARADVFSLGVVLWELCAGRRLFARDSEAATLAAVVSGPPPSAPSGWNEAVPPELDALVLSALERDPGRRIASAEELERALSSLLLRVARAPQDWDLRAFMHRLWPEGTTPSSARREETQVRRVPAGAGDAARAAPEGRGDEPGPADSTAATRTLSVAGRGRLRRSLLVALPLAAAAVAGLAAVRARGPAPAGDGERPAALAAAPRPVVPPVPAGDPPLVEDGGAPDDPAAPDAGSLPAAADALVETQALDPSSAVPGPAGVPDDAAEGDPGFLYVNATPWARILVDGTDVGETPRELRLPPGRHRVRLVHPTYGSAERQLSIRAGRRLSWIPTLKP